MPLNCDQVKLPRRFNLKARGCVEERVFVGGLGGLAFEHLLVSNILGMISVHGHFEVTSFSLATLSCRTMLLLGTFTSPLSLITSSHLFLDSNNEKKDSPLCRD